MSFLGMGGATLSIGAIVVTGVSGAVAAGAIAVATTQVAASASQPDPTSANLQNVNSPGYDTK